MFLDEVTFSHRVKAFAQALKAIAVSDSRDARVKRYDVAPLREIR